MTSDAITSPRGVISCTMYVDMETLALLAFLGSQHPLPGNFSNFEPQRFGWPTSHQRDARSACHKG